MKNSLVSILTLAVGLLAILGAAPATAAGDADAGKAKAMVCNACHGQNGVSSNPLWPNLAGQHEAYLAKQIRAFRDNVRQEPTMIGFVATLSDEDIDDLAAYFAGLPACP